MRQTFFIRKRLFLLLLLGATTFHAQQPPNVILIYADDLGYGDLSCYGATKIQTPHLDRLAAQGLRFTNAHATSATCTPSRYAMLTGQYPWRKSGTGILPGDAALILPEGKPTLATLFKKAGYASAVVGKWHLGLGNAREKNWNSRISPGPNEVGFDYSFIFPATADRVPTVFIENDQVVGSDPTDPIEVDYQNNPGNEPTGREHPELLKMRASPDHGHDGTIVNGIGRIGFMKGGKTARWTDEEMPLTFLEKAREFISSKHRAPFFLFYALTEPHVPRMPSTMFKGKSGLGFRGDAILQLDWTVGQIMSLLDQLDISRNTLLIVSSDNGPVLDDGYEDGAVAMLNAHTPGGPLRGGKYSAYEAGTRVPLLLRWPAKVKGGRITDALVSQIDFMASFSRLLNIELPPGEAPDSEQLLEAFLGKSGKGRTVLVKQGLEPTVLLRGDWKYICPSDKQAYNRLTNIDLGNRKFPQLFFLKTDPGEQQNLADTHPELVREMDALLQEMQKGKNRP